MAQIRSIPPPPSKYNLYPTQLSVLCATSEKKKKKWKREREGENEKDI